MQVEIKNIKVKKRIRKDTGNMTELKESLNKYGLLNPITINKKNELVAGFRRLEAAKSLGWEKIEAVVVQAEDKLTLLELELEENNVRKSFTREEQLDGYEALEKLRNPGFFKRLFKKIFSFFINYFDRREAARSDKKIKNGFLSLLSLVGIAIIVTGSILFSHNFISPVLRIIIEIIGVIILVCGSLFATKFFIGISKKR